MKAGSILALALAIGLGGAAAYGVRSMISQESLAAVPPPPQRTIVVASQPLSFGAVLTPDSVKEIPWGSDQIPTGAFLTEAELFEEGRRVVLSSTAVNEPILAAKVTGPNERGTLSVLLEPGKRAVSVRVDEVRGVSGFVTPGDRVDVILTRQGDADGRFADVLLQNVRILAVGQIVDERQEKPTVHRTATLELDLEGAQKVILAEGIGSLSLVLRQPGQVDQPVAAVDEAGGRVTVSDLAPVQDDGVAAVQQVRIKVYRNGQDAGEYTVTPERR